MRALVLALVLALGCDGTYDDMRRGITLPKTDQRWGNRVSVAGGVPPPPGTRNKATMVDTGHFPHPHAFLIQIRFQPTIGGVPFNPGNWVPTTVIPIEFTFRRGIDTLGGATEESFLASQPGTVLPRFVIAHSLAIDLELVGPLVGECFVEVIACPVDGGDLLASSGFSPAGIDGGFSTGNPVRFAANAAASVQFMGADVFRRQFFIMNHATTNLFVAFGPVVDLTAGAEKYTFMLQPGAVYESPVGGFTGIVTGIWDAADATGEALVTTCFP